MDESERALRLWLKGQLMAMIVIGVMTGAGLWLLGVQSWLVLGKSRRLLRIHPVRRADPVGGPGDLDRVGARPRARAVGDGCTSSSSIPKPI